MSEKKYYSKSYGITITDNSDVFLRAMDERGEELLEAFGIEGVKNTVMNITGSGHVDTGLLRNSFTYALSGQPAAISSYEGDSKSQYRPNAPIPSGTYSGNAPDGQKAVYIGTNIDYAIPQEEGYHRPDGAFVAGTHALQNGVEALRAKGKALARKIMGEG